MQILLRHKALYFYLSALLIFILTLPVFYVLFQIIQFPFSDSESTLELLSDIRTLNLLVKSILLAILVSVFTTIISFPLAFIFANFNFLLKRILFVLILLPFFIPPYIYAISWINLTTESGILNLLNISIYGFWGSVFVLTSWLFPLAFFFFLSSIKVNVRLEEAASLIKNKYQIFFKVTLPLILPGILAGMIFTFILGITNFSVPGALRLNVYPNEIFIQFGAFFNHQEALFLSFPLLLLSLSFILVLVWNYSGRLKKTEQKNDQIQLKQLNLKRTTLLYIFSGFLIVVVLVLPILALISGTNTFDVFLKTFSNTYPEIWHSFFYNFMSAILLTSFGFYLAYFRKKLIHRILRALMDIFILMLITIPGTIFGIVLIKFIQFDALSSILSSPLAVVLLSNIRYLPVAYFICIAGLSRIPEKYLEAARLSQQSSWKYLWKIIIPMNKNNIFGSLILVFVLCFGELDSAIMIYPPGFETMPLRIFSLLHYGANEMVYALSLIQVLIILIIIAFGFRWINKSIRYYA